MLNTTVVVLRGGVDCYSFIMGFMGCRQEWRCDLCFFLDSLTKGSFGETLVSDESFVE